MSNEQTTKTSKSLTLILRHRPETVGILLDRAGWTPVDVLLAKCAEHNRPITRAMLEQEDVMDQFYGKYASK